eukprot:NODE_977_length_1342_cov_125.211137_g809_i0.p1 GENE.NODE_977_length_1342_cov_125.211137_g809_i0~~NODE_977_length_1342_cov_125.211137_g809_i0.p1  ORF type:complete len:277 (-),score=63.87 NODE_977_length_1342_cov_125.211137_g809_i0:100-930(-)
MQACSQQDYALLPSFRFYLRVIMAFVDMSDPSVSHYALLSEHLLQVTMRVRAARQLGVRCCASIVARAASLLDYRGPHRECALRLLEAAVFLLGEYSHGAPDSDHMAHVEAVSRLELPPALQCVVCQAMLKMYSRFAGAGPTAPCALGAMLRSPHVEVQERASQAVAAIRLHKERGLPLEALFARELLVITNPLQHMMEPPAGLDLDTPLHSSGTCGHSQSSATPQSRPPKKMRSAADSPKTQRSGMFHAPNRDDSVCPSGIPAAFVDHGPYGYSS